MALKLRSPAFAEKGQIPAVHTCDGKGLSSSLRWSGKPAETQSFVLIVDDPDVPDRAASKLTWVHWILYNLPADLSSCLKEHATFPAVLWRALTTESERVTADRALQRGATDISSSSTRWTTPCLISIGRRRRSSRLR